MRGLGAILVGLLTLFLVITLLWAESSVHPFVVVSLQGHTLRLELPSEKRSHVFPVGVPRQLEDGTTTPLGTYFTGPDPHDRFFYAPARREPAYHAGLPFVRLGFRRERDDRTVEYPVGIHGPITPSLIWGTVSAGCIRMQPHQLERLYRAAIQHPSMPVKFIRGLDLRDSKPVEIDRIHAADPNCIETSIGVRPLTHLSRQTSLHDRICGGVDHWYAAEMSHGQKIAIRLYHRGNLRMELYGVRAINIIAKGRFGLEYQVPDVALQRGDRFLRIVAPMSVEKNAGRVIPYRLMVDLRD